MTKGEMGIGAVIVFVAVILVGVVASMILLQTGGLLQEKALVTSDKSEDQITTHVNVIEISATDGRDGGLSNFTQIVKLAPGSQSVKLDSVLLRISLSGSWS